MTGDRVGWGRLEVSGPQELIITGEGEEGALALESGTEMYLRLDSIFQASWHSPAYQFIINVPFSIF